MYELLEIPVAASAHAGEIDRMTVLTHWLMAVLFVGWGVFFIYTLIRFRSGANPKANYHGVKSHMASYIEWAVAAVELVLIVAFRSEERRVGKEGSVRGWAGDGTEERV